MNVTTSQSVISAIKWCITASQRLLTRAHYTHQNIYLLHHKIIRLLTTGNNYIQYIWNY